MINYYLLLFSFMLLISTILLVKLVEKEEFTLHFQSFFLPVCLINNSGKILWCNKIFIEKFNNLKNFEFDKTFNPKKIMHEIIATQNNTSWKLQHINIKKNFAVIFSKIKEDELNWWQDLPFPTALINKNNEIEEANPNFNKLIDTSQNLSHLIKNFEKAKSGKELLWQTKAGLAPILTWIKPYKDKNIIFLENRIEIIKLKNQAQESQHLQVLGQLSCNIIHDFNNLLTAIYGFTEILETSIPNNEMLIEIKRNAKQASLLAKELLNFVKEKPNELKIVNPGEFLKKSQIMLQKLLTENINLEVIVETHKLIEISETELEQIILNMAINSKDAIKDKGKLIIHLTEKTLKVATKINSISFLEKGDYIIIKIKDTGSGILKENINKVFTAFFSTKKNGSGIGLSSCLRIIQHASGGIDLKSSTKGTTFIIYFPISTKKITIKKIEQTQDKKYNFKKKNIVLIEDEEVIRKLASKSLKQEGYDVIAFENGTHAMQYLNKNNVDGVITDAVLPGMDGIEIAKILNKKQPMLPVLIVSGYSYEEITENINFEVQYLAKPFTLKILKEKINYMMQESI